MSGKIPVAVLGATGTVGQKFVRLLADHPWFELREVAASERSAGKSYREATRWIGDTPIPESVARLTVLPCDPASVKSPEAAGDEPSFVCTTVRVSPDTDASVMPEVPLVTSSTTGVTFDGSNVISVR